MPAILLSRLRKQCAQLIDLFNQPQSFVHTLHELLDHYTDHTHHPGQAGEPAPLLASYKVPKPVLHHIQRELAPLAASNPEAALELSDAIWAEPFLEFRILAASLLGQVPPNPSERILSRIQAWAKSGDEDRFLTELLTQGLSRCSQESPESLIEQVKDWLSNSDISSQRLGLRSLHNLLSSHGYENMPIFFSLLTPYTRKLPSQLRPDMLDILRTLARRVPKETAYFLRQNLHAPDNPDTAWLIRHCLHEFPYEIQDNLRTTVREIDHASGGL